MKREVILRLLVVPFVWMMAACGEDGGDSANGSPEHDAGPRGGPDAGTDNDTCRQGTRLFEPMALGAEGTEVIGRLQHDDETGDIYFTSNGELWVLRGAADEPQLLARGPTTTHIGFWIADDEVLLDNRMDAEEPEGEIGVLYSVARDGGEARPRVSFPENLDGGRSYLIKSVRVVGDEVFWISLDDVSSSGGSTTGSDTVEVIRKTSWRDPGKPVELYRSNERLNRLVVGAGRIFFQEQDDDPETTRVESVQRILDASDGTLADETAEARYGGEVMAADDTSMLVTRTDIERVDTSEGIGTWYVRFDGTHEEKLGDVFLLPIGPTTAASKDGTWLIVSVDGADSDRSLVQLYSEERGLRRLGCVAADGSSFALDLAADGAFVGIYPEHRSTVLRFER